MGTSERHKPLNGNWKSVMRSVGVMVPLIMLANKCLRGNVWGIPTENDVQLHNLFEFKVDHPSDTSGFVGDGDMPHAKPPGLR
jgi:hypothetical protein